MWLVLCCQKITMNEYPDYIRDEMERASYDKYIAAVHERERWQALSWREKAREIIQKEWRLEKKSLWYLFLAICVIYTVLHVLHIGPPSEDIYELVR